MPLRMSPTLREKIAGLDRPADGMWLCSGNAAIAEIIAAAGVDWILIDAEHAPNGLETLQAQLQAIAAYDVPAVVRLASADPVLIKQVLDLGATTLIVPMINSVVEAEQVAAAANYPPLGIRGIGSALARSGRWGLLPTYLHDANEHVSVFVQIEHIDAVPLAREIAAVAGIDGVFIGPSDLAATMGKIGGQADPEVRATVHRVMAEVKTAGKLVGVNAFDPAIAAEYSEAGAQFLGVMADVTAVARAAKAVAAHQ